MDLNKSFDKLIKALYINHKGLLIEKTQTGFRWAGQDFKTLTELDNHLKTIYETVSTQIRLKP